MPRYSVFIALSSGDYREVDWVIEAPNALAAAQHIIDADPINPADNRALIDPNDDFPLLLVVEERRVAIFTRDRRGHATSPAHHVARRHRDGNGPELHVVPDDGSTGT